MKKFYFTYGTVGQPFCGGWTEVEAPDINAACTLFRIVHPDKVKDTLNCGGIYAESSFKETTMYSHGNFGKRCWETITLSVERTSRPEN